MIKSGGDDGPGLVVVESGPIHVIGGLTRGRKVGRGNSVLRGGSPVSSGKFIYRIIQSRGTF